MNTTNATIAMIAPTTTRPPTWAAKSPREKFITVVDSILIFPTLILLVSMYFHLQKSNKSQHKITEAIKRARTWMGRGVMSSMIFGLMVQIFRLCVVAPLFIPTQAYCHAMESIWVFSYAAHKLSLYIFIYFRVSTFNDFFSDRHWSCLKIFGGLTGGFYAVVLLFITIFYRFNSFDAHGGVCQSAGRLGNPVALGLGATAVFLDFMISFVGLGNFAYLMICSPVLGQISKKDPEVGAAARNVIQWSAIALTSTVTLSVLILIIDNWALLELDVFINCLCMCLQYPKAIWILVEILFQWDTVDERDLESAEMVEAQKAPAKQQGAPRQMERVDTME